MFLLIVLSSIAAGLIATAFMLAVLYLPMAWGGQTFDVVRAIGSALTGKVDRRSSYLGAVLYFGGGVIFAIFYGWIASLLLGSNGITAPAITLSADLPTEMNLFFPLLGLILGIAHGGVIALFATILIIEHHPIEEFRTRYTLIVSTIFSHLVYGAVVMFFHHQFLQLLTRTAESA